MSRWIDRVLRRIGLARIPRGRQMSAYSGAQVNRLTADWVFAPFTSADQELRGDHRLLVRRARELARNDGYARRFLGLLEDNVVGPHGIRLQAQVRRPNGDLDIGINETIEAAWREWCQPENASVDGRLSFRDIQALAIRSMARDGEAIIREVIDPDRNRFGFSLQVIDPDQLDIEYNRAPGAGQNEIRMGVEIDRLGRPVAYWLWDAHPYDYQGRRRERIRVPADEIYHLYLVERPGQTRGVTWFAPILMPLKMLGGYEESEVVAARVAAAKMGFFRPNPEAVADPNAPAAGQAPTIDGDPGSFGYIPAYWDFLPWDPQHPNNAFDPFVKAVLRKVASGLGASYASLTGDLTQVNYSSIRAGLLAERDVWRTLQGWLVDHFLRRVYLSWFRWSITSGALVLPSRNLSRWTEHRWQPRGWAWVDPLKDIQASLAAIEGGLDSRTRIAAEQGRDFEEILADLVRERQLAEEYGVTFGSGSTHPAATAPEEREEEPAAAANRIEVLLHANGNGRRHGDAS